MLIFDFSYGITSNVALLGLVAESVARLMSVKLLQPNSSPDAVTINKSGQAELQNLFPTC